MSEKEVTFREVLDAILQIDKHLEEHVKHVDKMLALEQEKLDYLKNRVESHVLYTRTLTPPISEEPREKTEQEKQDEWDQATGEPTLMRQLRDSGVEPMGKLRVTPTEITPINFLGDEWGNINEFLRQNGWTWIREGRNSRWEPKK